MATGTYDPTLSTNLDKVRFYIQDTDTTNVHLLDSEINAMITAWGTYSEAAIACCEVLGVKFAAQAEEKTVGKLTLIYGNLAKKYTTLAKSLRFQLYKFGAGYMGGQTETDKEINTSDSDLVQPAFKRGMMKERLPVLNPDSTDD